MTEQKKRHLQITAAELDSVKSPLRKGAALKITEEELDCVTVGGDASSCSGRSYPPVTGAAPAGSGGKAANTLGRLRGMVPTGVVHMVVAGLLGALAAWGVNELLFDFRKDFLAENLVLHMGVWGAIIAAIIGFFFGAVQDFLNRHYKRAALSGLKWMCGAALGGFLGSALGQYVYGLLEGGSPHVSMSAQVLARTLGWGLLGTGCGLGYGGMTWSRKRLINGLLGGLIGGVAGGLLFDFVAVLHGARDGAASRLVGFVALACIVGFMIGVVEHLRRKIWVFAEGGPMQGKQYILFGEHTTFGASGKADNVLYGDPAVPPLAFSVEQAPGGGPCHLMSLAPSFPLTLNERGGQRFRLRGSDIIQCGKHRLRFFEKRVE